LSNCVTSGLPTSTEKKQVESSQSFGFVQCRMAPIGARAAISSHSFERISNLRRLVHSFEGESCSV
jgi:hypothetical protein